MLACDQAGDNVPAPEPLSANSPGGALALVAGAWNGYAWDNYRNLLVPGYRFHFRPEDVGRTVGGYAIPAAWDDATDGRALAGMFRRVYALHLSLDANGEGEYTADGAVYNARNRHLKLVLDKDARHGWVADGLCDFTLVRGDAGYWYLSDWYDRTATTPGAAGPGFVAMSLGEARARLYAP